MIWRFVYVFCCSGRFYIISFLIVSIVLLGNFVSFKAYKNRFKNVTYYREIPDGLSATILH